MAAWRYRTSQIYPKCSVDLFGRDLIEEVSASKSSVLDFVSLRVDGGLFVLK